MADASQILPAQNTAQSAPSDQYRQQAYESTDRLSSMQTSAPKLLTELKQNLVNIFAKDNPLIGARNTALADYLSTASQSRADVLPGNMPQVEGRALTLSPTQQNAITTSRLSASLAPLAGYNEILKGMYGNIGDLVQGAGGIYENALNAEQTRTSNLMKLYELAASEEASKRAASAAGSGGFDINAILAALQGNQPELEVQGPPGPDADYLANSIYGTVEPTQASSGMSREELLKNILSIGPLTSTGVGLAGLPDLISGAGRKLQQLPGGISNFIQRNYGLALQ